MPQLQRPGPAALDEFRRVLVPAGMIVAGFFPGDEVTSFEHNVVTAWFWPVDEFSTRLRQAGITELERMERPAEGDHRPHAAMATTAI